MSFRKLILAGAVAASALVGGTAQAALLTGSFSFNVQTGDTNGAGFNAVQGVTPFVGSPATASFTYTGALNFSFTGSQNSNSSGDLNSAWFGSATNAGGPNYGISLYSGSGSLSEANADFTTLAGFLAASGSASNFNYGSLYTINLGSLTAGTVLTITHDDGVSLFQGSTQLAGLTSGPTSVITESVTIGSTGAVTLYYSRQNGSPSILSVDAVAPAVPEASTWMMMILAFTGLGFMGYRQSRKSRAAAAA